MSRAGSARKSFTVSSLQKCKSAGQKISMVTCYDAAFGKLIEESLIDMVLVGDSLGNVVLGFDSTIPVTVDHMIHHSAAVTRAVKRAFVAVDMPFMSYSTIADALKNGARLIQEGGAAALKLEGGKAICPQVEALVGCGLPVIGHLGLTPQSVHALGGYKVQGASVEAAKQIEQDALALEAAGVCALVLEMVPRDLAKSLTRQLKVPTIGIGAGPDCDGQVLVIHDLLGFNSSFSPKFLKKYVDLSSLIGAALASYSEDVKSGGFPSDEHSFGN